MKSTYFFRDKPIFGLDIGTGTLRAVQTSGQSGNYKITAYGAANFDVNHTKNGVLVEPQAVANSYKHMMEVNSRGNFTTPRVALSLPAKRTYSRAITLPKLPNEELEAAIHLEAEQYIPFSINSLYIDYSIIHQTDTEIELFMVAAPKTIIDSYLELTKILKIEPVLIETSIDAASRLFSQTDYADKPSILVDFGHESVDITMVDKVILATGTVGSGSKNLTAKISEELGADQAHSAKPNTQNSIAMALNPQLELLYKEIHRMIRYFQERSSNTKQISQIVIMGNGASLPGLPERMTEELKIPVIVSDPWQVFKYTRGLQTIPDEVQGSFITAAGLAIASPKAVFI
jgi:type IV pilus assembly protein PilM